MKTTQTITELTILNRAYHYTLDLWAKEQQRADDFHAAERPAPSSIFIKDQKRGDVKRIKPGFYSDPETAREHCYFRLASYADAHKVNGETIKTYESWYA